MGPEPEKMEVMPEGCEMLTYNEGRCNRGTRGCQVLHDGNSAVVWAVEIPCPTCAEHKAEGDRLREAVRTTKRRATEFKEAWRMGVSFTAGMLMLGEMESVLQLALEPKETPCAD